MFIRFSPTQLAEKANEYLGEQMFCVLYPALKEAANGYSELEPEEVWSEAQRVADELAAMTRPDTQMETYLNRLMEGYQTFLLPEGRCEQRAEECGWRTTFLVVLCAVYMLAPGETATDNPNRDAIVHALAYVRQHPLYDSFRMKIRETEEREETQGHVINMLQWQLQRATLPYNRALVAYRESEEWKECLRGFKVWVKGIYKTLDTKAMEECKKQLWAACRSSAEGDFLIHAGGKSEEQISRLFYESVRKDRINPHKLFELQLSLESLDIWAVNAEEPIGTSAINEEKTLKFLKVLLTEDAFLKGLPAIDKLFAEKGLSGIDWIAVYRLLCLYKYIPAVGFKLFVGYLADKLGHAVISSANLRQMGSRQQLMEPNEFKWPSGLPQKKISSLEHLMCDVAELLNLDILF